MSYNNIIMYGAVIPSFNTKKKDGGSGDGQGGADEGEVMDAGNPEDWKKIKDFYRHRKKTMKYGREYTTQLSRGSQH